MSLTFITDDGELVIDGNAGPWQYTPEGFNTGLSANSKPLSAYTGLNYEGIYRSQIWVAACINFLTRQVARLPLKVYELDSQNVKRPVKTGPLYDLIQRPAPRCGPVHLKQWMTFPTLLHGNGTLKKVRPKAGAAPTMLLPAPWRRMTPYELDDSGQIDYWKIERRTGGPGILQPYDVAHFAWFAPDGLVGVSPLEHLGVTVRAELAAQKFQEASHRNSARPSGGVSLPESVAGDKILRRELRQDLQRLHAGIDNTGRPIILPPGAKWETFGGSARDAELVESRKLNREEAAAGYNLPQPLVGILDHATYSNVAELHKILYGPVMGPWLVLEEETFIAQVIIGEPAFEGQFVEYDLAEVLRGDPLKEATALKTQMQTGLLTINEARQIRNLPKIDHPDCDRPMIPANNLIFVGGTTPAGNEEEGETTIAGALSRNLERLGERLYRKTKAGQTENAWDPDRFRRELRDDLAKAKDHNADSTAKTWVGVVTAVIADALGDADTLRDSFAALNPATAGAAS